MSDPPPPFRRLGPAEPVSPVVLSVPHAGRGYAPALLAAARLPRRQLESLEDRLVDRLIWRAVEAGASAIVAVAPRAEIDLNRDLRELDPAMIRTGPHSFDTVDSLRTRGGLGLIPARIAGAGSVWRQRLAPGEIARRIEQVYRPYHAALEAEMMAALKRFGVAVLLDCHSMPPRPGGSAEIVLGDRHGRSIAAELADAAERAAAKAGFTVARNAPYAGGHIADRHGRPAEGLHALQIEIDRSFYLDPALRSPGPGFDRVAGMLAGIVKAVAEAALGEPHAIAAE